MADGVDEDSDDDISMTHSHNMVRHHKVHWDAVNITYRGFYFPLL